VAPDWHRWHQAYDDPASTLARRLPAVRGQIGEALAAAPPGPVRLIGMCAGQGRDVMPVLAAHPRRGEVSARLVELDPDLAAVARASAAAAGLAGVEVVTGDAGVTSAYTGMVPADIVLACGVFGNISEADIEFTIGCCAGLCAVGGTVVWTRGRTEPDLVPQICRWFGERGFELCWVSEPAAGYGVGMHRFTGPPRPLPENARMFSFLD
jgi:hypothetical protein